MNNLFDRLMEDCRFREGLNACINCGTCTAICPAAEFYKYDPRHITTIIQSRDDDTIEKVLKSEAIWYCGECMSCVSRCPRKNAPGLIIMALRSLSQDLGYFTESEKGRQQLALKRSVGENILNFGYCIYPRTFDPFYHPESGTIGKWVETNLEEIHKRLGSNLDGEGPGVLRKIPQSALDELKAIFDVTGGTERFEIIEQCSKQKAAEMGLSDEDYFQQVTTKDNKNHSGKRQNYEH
jgi:heterodisulfide reductase subunit C